VENCGHGTQVLLGHVFRVLATATPDKRLLGWAGFLLWSSGQRNERAGEAFDDAQQFAAIFGSLLTLEELLRALYEANGQSILRIAPGSGVVRCHLAMLDDQSGELLDRHCLEHASWGHPRLFCSQADFRWGYGRTHRPRPRSSDRVARAA